MYWFAEQLGGIAVSLEHRYFGESLPFGNASWQLENVKLLTLENDMTDAVTLVEYPRPTIPGADESKAIVASGSYGWHVLTFIRQIQPEMFFAALAFPAPLTGYIHADLETSEGHSDDYTLQQFFKASFKGTEKIRNAFTVMHDQICSGNRSVVQKALNLCTTPPTNEVVIAILDNLYDNAITLSMQYDYAIASPGCVPVIRFPRSSMPLSNLRNRLTY